MDKYTQSQQALQKAMRFLTDEATVLTDQLRARELRKLSIQPTMRESDYNDLVKLAGMITGFEMAFITFVDDEHVWVKANWGGEHFSDCHPKEFSLCTYAVGRPDQVTVIRDAVNDERVNEFKYVRDGYVGSYLGVPILSPNKIAIGMVCCVNVKALDINDQQIGDLTLISRLVASLMFKRKTD